jgi:hypothetical protein
LKKQLYNKKNNTTGMTKPGEINQVKSLAPPNNEINFTVQKKANETNSPNNLRTGMEILFAQGVGDVKTHHNFSQPLQLSANAFVPNNQANIVAGREKHLPYENWQVVQQNQSRISTLQMKSSVNINDDPTLEKEADVMGTKALQLKGKGVNPYLNPVSGNGYSSALQLKKKKKAAKSEEERTPEAPETEGAQVNIQRKMVELCKQLASGGAISDEVEEWYGNVIVNGLCGGWAALHRREPETLERIWSILVEWDPEDDINDDENKTNRSVQKVILYKKDIVSSLVFAYNEMSRLEPHNYDEAPEEVSSMTREIDESHLTLMRGFNMRVGKNGGGQAIVNRILNDPKVKKPGNNCIIHIETEKHHMSVRTRSVKAWTKIVAIVESEKSGIVFPGSTVEAAKVLDGGIYLGKVKDFNIEITIYRQ